MENNGPGKWSDWVFAGADASQIGTSADHGREISNEGLMAAQDLLAQHTVVIGPERMEADMAAGREIKSATGVLVQLCGDVYGVLTAAHVLRIDKNNREDAASFTIVGLPDPNKQSGIRGVVRLPDVQCTVDGFDNCTERGPDIAVIPLWKEQWEILEGQGMTAYDLDRARWTDDEKTKFRKLTPWAISVILGARAEASRIVRRNNENGRSALTIIETNTRVDDAEESGEYDYLALPSEVTEDSHPTHWRRDPPGTAAQEIERLYGEGVTQEAWGGTSGAGVWNVVVGANADGRPNGRGVGVELAGICFYASQEKGCVIAHGGKSIRTIAERHLARLGGLTL